MAAVVFDDEAADADVGDEAEGAGGGAGMADDIGDGFAEGECEHGLFGGGEGRWSYRGLGGFSNPGLSVTQDG